MKHEIDTAHNIIAEINGYTIVRSETREQDKITGEISGHKKVYYDVCDGCDLLESFKTLKEAKHFCMA